MKPVKYNLPPARKMLARWTGAVTLGGMLAAALVYVGTSVGGGELFLPFGLAAALALAACETWALKPVSRRDRWVFFAATALGAGWGALTVIILGVAIITGRLKPLGELSFLDALTLGGAIMGVILGLAQWLVLRRRFADTKLWVPTHVVAGVIVVMIMSYISGLLSGESALGATLVGAGLASAVAGVITGLAVTRLK